MDSISATIDEVVSLETTVRDHINTHRYQIALIQNSNTWNQICSSLDVIGDTLLAVRSYFSAEYPEDRGLRYIYTYGLLQSLFVQQDALTNLAEAFSIQYETSADLLEIRGLRNAAIGHPTKQVEKGTRYYNYISRMSMSQHGFELLRHSESLPFRLERVDIRDLATKQLADIKLGLVKVSEILREIDQEHRGKFMQEPLSDIFHSTMGYSFEKISEGVHSGTSGNREFGLSMARSVRKTYEKFQTALDNRNELNEYTKFDLDEYFHAINMLIQYLSSTEGPLEEFDARIYISYMCHEHERFVQIAKEIDEEYSKEA